jgi:hypothetical protein
MHRHWHHRLRQHQPFLPERRGAVGAVADLQREAAQGNRSGAGGRSTTEPHRKPTALARCESCETHSAALDVLIMLDDV